MKRFICCLCWPGVQVHGDKRRDRARRATVRRVRGRATDLREDAGPDALSVNRSWAIETDGCAGIGVAPKGPMSIVVRQAAKFSVVRETAPENSRLATRNWQLLRLSLI